jgi:hypothetical protein
MKFVFHLYAYRSRVFMKSYNTAVREMSCLNRPIIQQATNKRRPYGKAGPALLMLREIRIQVYRGVKEAEEEDMYATPPCAWCVSTTSDVREIKVDVVAGPSIACGKIGLLKRPLCRLRGYHPFRVQFHSCVVPSSGYSVQAKTRSLMSFCK